MQHTYTRRLRDVTALALKLLCGLCTYAVLIGRRDEPDPPSAKSCHCSLRDRRVKAESVETQIIYHRQKYVDFNFLRFDDRIMHAYFILAA